MERCFYIGQAYNEDDASVGGYVVSVVGNIVELHINAKYGEWKSAQGRPCIPFPAPAATDFFDALDDSCGALAGFLGTRHPAVDAGAAEQWCRLRKARDGDRSLVPDILSNDSGIRELYEIKSRSLSSLAKGRQKVRNFNEMAAGLQIQYGEGDQYAPDGRSLVYSGTWAGVPIEWYLRWSLVERAILGYQLCCEVSSATVQEAALFLALRFVLLMLVLGRNPAFAAAAALLLRLRSPLLSSVGEDAGNDEADVRYVRLLLSDWRGRNGLAPLPVVGWGSAELDDAIEEFQATLGTSARVIEPGSEAIATLERLHLEGGLPEVSEEIDVTGGPAELDDPTALVFRDEDGVPLDLEAAAVAQVQYYLDSLHDDGVDFEV